MPSSASLEVSFREHLPLSLPLPTDVLMVRCCFSAQVFGFAVTYNLVTELGLDLQHLNCEEHSSKI